MMHCLLLALRLGWLLYGNGHATELVKDLPPCINRSPPGRGLTCGQHGHIKLKQKRQFIYHNVTSLSACHLECIAQASENNEVGIPEPSCYSLGYNSQTETCSGFENVIRGGLMGPSYFEPDDKSPVVFYDTQCFMCAFDSPAPPGTNLLANAGFQTPTSSHSLSSPWYVRGKTASNDDVPLYGGKISSPGFRSTKALTNEPNQQFLTTQIYINPPSRGLYDYTFDYKFQAFDAGRTFLISADMDITLMQAPTTNNNTWSKFKGTQELGAYYPQEEWNLRLASVSIQGGSKDVNFLIDNVKITPAQLPFQAKQGAPNLLKDGGFESGSFKNFRLNYKGPDVDGIQNRSLTFVPSGATGSRYALEFDPAKVKPTKSTVPVLTFQLVQQSLTLKDGVDYLVGVTYRLDQDNDSCLDENDFFLILIVDDMKGVNSDTVHNQTGTYARFDVPSIENAQYTTYQVPLPSFSSFQHRNPAKFQFYLDWRGSGGVPATCRLVVDEVFIKEKA